MSTDQDKDSFSLKRNRGDGGLEGIGGAGLLLGSPDKKKRKANTQAPSFAPLSEYAPPANPSSDHLVASNPFDDNYNSPTLSLKPLNSSSLYFGPSHYTGFGGYGPPRPAPHIPSRMPSPYGGPYPMRNQPHLFAQGPMGPMAMGFNRPPAFSYGHPESAGFVNQHMFNNNGSMQLPGGLPFRPGPGENSSQLPLPIVNQNQSGMDGPGPGFGMEGPASGSLPLAGKPVPDVSSALPQLSSFAQASTPTPKQDPSESANKSASQNAASARKQNSTSEEGGAQDGQAEPKGKNRAGGEGGVEKINGVLHPGAEPLKKTPQPGALIEPVVERSRRPGAGARSAALLASSKPAPHPSRLGSVRASASEPVYPCGICLNEVNDDQEAILCEASCQKWFHRVCTGMTETAYNMLTAEAAAVWGCDGCMQEKGAQLLKTRETSAPPTANSEGQS
ncbi:pygopus homolog 1 [Electrophorus electricus]|uniref:PHD-type domain-containing protein n=1 Tax=Electrophorus electricus TaxID=8005 RepID=A0AAY5E8V6_ELEEL|nr:pygopus homolog 1 [Electrophorus electricus]